MGTGAVWRKLITKGHVRVAFIVILAGILAFHPRFFPFISLRQGSGIVKAR